METHKSSIRSRAERVLLLVFAPLAIALIANIATNLAASQSVTWWLWALAAIAGLLAILLYFAVYTTKFDEQIRKVEVALRTHRFRNPKVLVLDGTLSGRKEESAPSPEQTNKSPQDWQSRLTRFGWQVKQGPIQQMMDGSDPDVVVNPFGEVYPEENSMTHTTAYKIREYVYRGGVYVNVAGIPFWYTYDPRSGEERKVAGWFERKPDDQTDPFEWRPLFRILFPSLNTEGGHTELVECFQTQEEIQRFGNIVDAGQSNQILKFRAYPSRQSGQTIPLLRSVNQQLYIILGLRFGKGCFLFAGVHIDDASATFEKVVAAIKGWAEFESRGRKPKS